MNNIYQKKTSIKSAMTDISTLAYRNLLKTKHNPEKLLDITLMPVIFMIMFSFLFGGAISGSVEEYLPIIVPGILIQTLISTSATAGTELREDINTGVFDRFYSLPITKISPLAGLLIADIFRYTVAATISIATGYLIGWRPTAGFGYLLFATVLIIFACWAVSWIFATLGLMFKSTSTISGLAMMVTFILTFISSAYVPIDTLPTPLRIFAQLNPITHIIEAFKSIAYNGIIGQDVVYTLLSSFIILIIFVPLTLRIYSRQNN